MGRASARQLAAAAVAAAERGWAVFPCRPGDKRPAIERWEQRASASPAQVAQAWRERFPGANVGVACGRSGLVVIDLDTHDPLPDDWRLPGMRDGRDVLAQLAEWAGQPWPATATVQTPTGGWHLYYAAPARTSVRNSAGALGPSIDVRAQGGYVLAAGSVLDEGAYQQRPDLAAIVRGGRAYEPLADEPPAPLPGWLVRMAAVETAAPAPRSRPGPPAVLEARIRGLLAHVAAGTPGDRNGRLYWAACRAGELAGAGHGDGELIMEQLVSAALAAGLAGGEREARRTAASGMRAGGAP